MKIRLGYVALPLTCKELNYSTVTYTQFKKLDIIEKLDRIDKVIMTNLERLQKILLYNHSNHIHFYRTTSHLVPFLSLDKISFDYLNPYKEEYQKIGRQLKEWNMRMDIHPDQFMVLNSIQKEVLENTIRYLTRQAQIVKAMKIETPIMILHVGSSIPSKEEAMKRFIDQFNLLPKDVQAMIALENDDKIYQVEDVLWLCEKLNIPMVLDYHHFLCNNKGVKIELFLKRIFNTWEKTKQIPKVHFSSPKSKRKKERRSHHDYIDFKEFYDFLNVLKKENRDVDIMIEAKKKDLALFKLLREIKYKTDYLFLDETTIQIEGGDKHERS